MRNTLILAAALFASSLVSVAAPLVQNGQTVAFLGDSITEQGAATPGGYVRLVASGLAANGIEIKVVPAGISGHKSDQMLARLERDVLSKKPDWMTLSCGVNDVWHGEKGVALEDYKKNVTAIVDRCQKAGVKVLVLTATQIKLPVDNPNNIKLAAYNAFLRDLAKERSLPLADLNADMVATQDALKAAGIKRVLTGDGVHMNIYGNLMMAKGVLKGFGLTDAQVATSEAKWQKIPETVQIQTVAKVKLSLAELAALEAEAAKKEVTVDALIGDKAAAAIKASLATSSSK